MRSREGVRGSKSPAADPHKKTGRDGWARPEIAWLCIRRLAARIQRRCFVMIFERICESLLGELPRV